MALPVEVNFADSFDPRQHVVGRLAAHPDQLGADNPGHKIARQIEDFLRRGAVESFAKDRGHGAGEGLHFRPERHAQMGAALVIDLQVDADFVGAFFVFAHVFEVELFVRPRLLFRRAVGIGDEGLAPLHLRQLLEKIDDVLQLLGIHHANLCS